MPRFSNCPFLATTLSFLSSRAYPDFLPHRSYRRPLMWFSLKRTTCSRPKPQLSTGNPGKPRDLQFRGPFVETRNDKGEVGVSMRTVMIGGGCGPVGAGTRMAHRRSARFARDDKQGERRCKERAVAEPRHLSNLIWTGLSSAVPAGLDSYSAARTAAENALVPLVPPTSRVSVFFSMYTFSRADCTRSAVLVSPI